MLSTRKHPYFAFMVIATDIVMILVAFSSAYWIRFSGFPFAVSKGIPPFEDYFRLMVAIIPLFLIIFRSYRLYQPERHIRRVYELLTLVKAITLSIIFTMSLTFIYREFSYSRMVLLIAWFTCIFLCCSGRYFLIQLEYYIRRHKNRNKLLLIGISRNARKLIQWTKENPHYGQDVVGILSCGTVEDVKHYDGIPVLGSVTNLNMVLDQERIDEVIITDPSISRDIVMEIMLKCENKMVGFKLVADFYGLMTHYVGVEYVSNVPLLGPKALPLDDPMNRLLKRGFDLIISICILLFLSPLFLLIGILIKMTSPGPVFYQQERVGRDKKVFKLYKFRTMVIDAEQKSGPVWTDKDDPRVTAIGKILRQINLDELPQIWNVIKGDMSLVGPRPERPYFISRFRESIPRYMSRHKIKSGITGWAQIHGLRGNTSLEERIKYDLYYMENWTLMMDIEILVATLFAYRNAY